MSFQRRKIPWAPSWTSVRTAFSCGIMSLSSEDREADRNLRDHLADVLAHDLVQVRDSALRNVHDVVRLELHVLRVILAAERPLEKQPIALIVVARAAHEHGVLEARLDGEAPRALNGLERGQSFGVIQGLWFGHLTADEDLPTERSDDDGDAGLLKLFRVGLCQVVRQLVGADPGRLDVADQIERYLSIGTDWHVLDVELRRLVETDAQLVADPDVIRLVLDPERGHVRRGAARRRGECATREHCCDGEEQNAPSVDQPPPHTAVFRNVKLRLSDNVLLQTHLCFLSPRGQATPVPANSLANTNRSLAFHARFVRHCKASTGSGTAASYWVLSAVYDATRVPIGAKDFSL